LIILETQDLCKRFGGLKAVNNVNITVNGGEIYGLIGPNGAGKTTLLNTITGTYSPDGGKVYFDGKNVTCAKPYTMCHHGMARTYQIVRSFQQMTVLENLLVAGIFGAGLSRAIAAVNAEKYLTFVEFPFKSCTQVEVLNTMQLKRLEMARALCTDCKMLLLDEIAAGLTPGELVEIMALIRRIRGDMGITIIIVEHLMKLIMGVCDRISVLCSGEKLMEGTPQEIIANEDVQRAYLDCNKRGNKNKKGCK
jgi:branched-chain amino acid transport system ATP-binding protein